MADLIGPGKPKTADDLVEQLQQLNELVSVVAIQQLRIYDLLLLLNLASVGSQAATEEKVFEAVSLHEQGRTLGPHPALIPEQDEDAPGE